MYLVQEQEVFRGVFLKSNVVYLTLLSLGHRSNSGTLSPMSPVPPPHPNMLSCQQGEAALPTS